MKQSLALLTIVAFLSTGCEKDLNSGSVTLNYEIVSSSAFESAILGSPSLTVTYTNETGQSQSEQINTNASTWSKTIKLTSTQRPIMISLGASGYTSNSTGTTEARLYVNGVVKANVTSQIQPVLNNGFFTATLFHLVE